MDDITYARMGDSERFSLHLRCLLTQMLITRLKGVGKMLHSPRVFRLKQDTIVVRSGNAHSSVGGSDSSIYNDILTSADCDWGGKEYVTWRSLINIKFTLIMKKTFVVFLFTVLLFLRVGRGVL